MCDALVATYVTSHSNSSVVLPRVWQLNNEAVLRAMVALYQKDVTTIARSLDVCQELKVLKTVLEATSAPFCFELAALAARREFLNLEKWLGEQFSARGVPFMQAAVSFLDIKLREDSLTISPAAVSIMLVISHGFLCRHIFFYLFERRIVKA